jgi:DNA-binding transcriptional regulator GbsR (MarR family)
MIEAGGRLCQMLGLPRSTGQIYGLLYLSPKALSLDDIVELLSISKGSASTGTRQLIRWRAIRLVWVPGERRDHFDIEADLGNLLRAAYTEFVKPRVASSRKRLDQMTASLDSDLASGHLTKEDYKFCQDRLRKFGAIQKKLQTVLPLAERML